jgi:uncharacterized membrane protein
MKKNNHDSFVCPICNLPKAKEEERPAKLVQEPVGDLIRKKHPDWGTSHIICNSCLRRFRSDYIEDALEAQRGELSEIEKEVIDSFKEQELVSRNINPEFDQELTFGQRLADHVAEFGGSWHFIILFGVILFGWIAINSFLLYKRPFDPYPFILLNLLLSCIAALQAPVIMMSQNRQEAKDRLRAEHDYRVNLKAELEIRHLTGKVDLLLTHQWQRLLEIQRIQMELMEELVHKRRG